MGKLLKFVIGAIVLLWIVGFVARLAIRLIILGTLVLGIMYLVGAFTNQRSKR